MANWHCSPGPFVQPHVLLEALGSCCAETKQAAQRGKVVSPPSGDKKTLGGLILGHKLICHHITGTCSNTLFLFLTVLLRHSMQNVWVCPCKCIFGLLQSVLNRAARILFTEHIRPSHTTAFPLHLEQNPNSFGYKTLPNLVSTQYQFLLGYLPDGFCKHQCFWTPFCFLNNPGLSPTFETLHSSFPMPRKCFPSFEQEKTLESPLDLKEIKPVHPKGNQP